MGTFGEFESARSCARHKHPILARLRARWIGGDRAQSLVRTALSSKAEPEDVHDSPHHQADNRQSYECLFNQLDPRRAYGRQRDGLLPD